MAQSFVLIDGELLPWRALGNNLIDESYLPIAEGILSETKLLKESGFDNLYEELLSKMNETDFRQDFNTMNSKQLNKKYGGCTYETFKNVCLEEKEHLSTKEIEYYNKIYCDQIKIYGQDSDIKCKPFSILKIYFEDGKEFIPGINNSENNDLNNLDQCEMFKLLSDDEICVVNFGENNFDSEYFKVKDFYDKLTINKFYEGIVIKPNFIVIPYFIAKLETVVVNILIKVLINIYFIKVLQQ